MGAKTYDFTILLECGHGAYSGERPDSENARLMMDILIDAAVNKTDPKPVPKLTIFCRRCDAFREYKWEGFSLTVDNHLQLE